MPDPAAAEPCVPGRGRAGLIREKNPKARIVATAITLESVGLLSAAMADFASAEAVCVTVARDKKAGPYHLMMGQNPVYIFTFQN